MQQVPAASRQHFLLAPFAIFALCLCILSLSQHSLELLIIFFFTSFFVVSASSSSTSLILLSLSPFQSLKIKDKGSGGKLKFKISTLNFVFRFMSKLSVVLQLSEPLVYTAWNTKTFKDELKSQAHSPFRGPVNDCSFPDYIHTDLVCVCACVAVYVIMCICIYAICKYYKQGDYATSGSVFDKSAFYQFRYQQFIRFIVSNDLMLAACLNPTFETFQNAFYLQLCDSNSG